MSYDPVTRAYRDTHLDKGWTIKAVFRAPKRADQPGVDQAIAPEIFQALAGHSAVPDYSDLRPARRAKNLTLTAAAEHEPDPGRVHAPGRGHPRRRSLSARDPDESRIRATALL